MRDWLGSGTVAGYCTNVHGGETYPEVLANLNRYTVAIKQRVSPDQPMGLGLWLSAAVARQVVADQQIAALRDWLRVRGLFVFTLNGFPYGGFHGPVVKHRVYQPDWCDPRRLAYTLDLIQILAGLIDDDATQGSISTLPIGWLGRIVWNTTKSRPRRNSYRQSQNTWISLSSRPAS